MCLVQEKGLGNRTLWREQTVGILKTQPDAAAATQFRGARARKAAICLHTCFTWLGWSSSHIAAWPYQLLGCVLQFYQMDTQKQ